METINEKIGTLALLLTMLGVFNSPHPILLVLCYCVHELGHLVFMKLTGAKTRKIRGGVFHLSIGYDCSSISYKRELLVYSGGIIFNFLFALIAFLINQSGNEALTFLVVCNLSLGLMNLYPVSILDGGGILKTVLLMMFSEKTAESVSKIASFVFSIMLWLVAVYLQLVFSSNISLFFISILLLVQLCFSI